MSLVSRFTVTPLLYACGALLALSIGLGIALKVQASKVDTAQANERTAQAERTAAITERDAWKGRAQDNATAAKTSQSNVDTLRTELATAQKNAATLRQQSRTAIAQAEAAQRDAERTLAKFAQQFQTESRKPDCERALASVDRFCPALRGY